MLASPVCWEATPDGASCARVYPSFGANGSVSAADSQLSYCGLARINPAHVLDSSTCTTSNRGSCLSMAGGGQAGVVTDMYLYITAVQDSQCNAGALAWARPCLLDHDSNRPIMGSANVCPYALSGGRDTLVPILVHEVRTTTASAALWCMSGTACLMQSPVLQT